MDIVLGVSMTPTTVRMVLVEGEKADGSIVDHDAFDITANDGSATSLSAAEQVVEAVLGTKESATAGGHHLKSIGVTWSDHAEASALRDALAARGIDDVMLVSDGHAAARAGPGRRPGRWLRHHRTVVHRSGHRDAVGGADRRRLRREGVEPLPAQRRRDGRPDRDGRGRRRPGLAAAGHVRRRLRRRRQLGEGAPGASRQPAGERARRTGTRAGPWRGAGIGHRACLRGDHRRPGLLAGSRRDHGRHRLCGRRRAPRLSWLRSAADARSTITPAQTDMEPIAAEEGRKPFLLVGSALTSIFVVGVVALVISLAVSIRPTVDQRPSPGPNAIVPSTEAPAPAPAPVQEAQQPVAPPPPAETIKPPVPVACRRPPRPAGAAPGVRRAGPRPAGARARPATGCAAACSRGAAARTASRGASAGALYSGAGVQPAGVQPVPAAAGLLPAAQAVDAAVAAAVATAAAGASRPAAATRARSGRGSGGESAQWLRSVPRVRRIW